MLFLAFLLSAFADDVGPGPVVAADWAMCDGGRYADLRPDIPLVAVTDPVDNEGAWRPAFDTGFVLYRDGTLIARKGFGLSRWRLGPRATADLWRRIGGDRLLALEPFYDRVSERERREISRWSHAWPPTTTLHLWKDGCHRTITLRGLSLLVTATTLGRPVLPGIPRALIDEHRQKLSMLPPPLVESLRLITAQLPAGGRRWCSGASCFARDRLLLNQERWDGSLELHPMFP